MAFLTGLQFRRCYNPTSPMRKMLYFTMNDIRSTVRYILLSTGVHAGPPKGGTIRNKHKLLNAFHLCISNKYGNYFLCLHGGCIIFSTACAIA